MAIGYKKVGIIEPFMHSFGIQDKPIVVDDGISVEQIKIEMEKKYEVSEELYPIPSGQENRRARRKAGRKNERRSKR